MPLVRIAIVFVTSLVTLLSGNFSLVDFLGWTDGQGHLTASFLTPGPKGPLEFRLRAGLALTILALNALHDYFTFIRPQQGIDRFRTAHLNNLKKEWTTKNGFKNGMRVNVMYVRRCWYFAWLIRRFAWTWNWNFDPPDHKDANMWIHISQGVCGTAFRAERAKFVRFDSTPSSSEGSWLMKWQERRTQHVLAILSVPMLLDCGGTSPSWKCVGVINVDAVTEAAADVLERNADDLSAYFLKQGFLLAQLS